MLNDTQTSLPVQLGKPEANKTRDGHHGIVFEVALVTARLEEAGRTLLSLPHTGPSTRLVQGGMEWVRDAVSQSGRDAGRIRPAIPDAAQITRMDEALAWIPLIPIDKYVLRRIVGARCLINPMTGRYQYSWRRLGEAIGADHKAVQRWHAQGLGLITACLNRPPHQDSRRFLSPSRASRPAAAVRS